MEIDTILQAAQKLGASDIHLKPGREPIIRINGKLHELPNAPKLDAQSVVAMAQKIMNERQILEFKENHEVDLAYSLAGVGRFRTNIFQQRGSVAISMRSIPHTIHSFEQLHLPPVMAKIAEYQRGMVLVTGATGSGKSTTLAAMIDYINSRITSHIITIEDPIEFLMRDKKSIISQREVGFDTRSFGKALRSALRQDPDVILVGEMRDQETITTALMAAETGHLVFSTLHTVDVMETINRILSFYDAHHLEQIRFQLSSALRSIVSQRLITRSDKAGRVPAIEIMLTTSRIRECIIQKEKTHEIVDAMEKGYSTYGMQTFDMSLMTLVKAQMISYEEAMKNSTNPGDFALKFQGISSTAGAEFAESTDHMRQKTGKQNAPNNMADKKVVIERFSK